MSYFTSVINLNFKQHKGNVATAVDLQRISIPTEIIAILISYTILYESLSNWVIGSMLLVLGRIYFFSHSTRANQLTYFLLSNLLSICIWLSFGIICSNLAYLDVLEVSLLLTGIVSGAILFLTYIKYLYCFYSVLTLGIFGCILLFKGIVFVYLGGGILILVAFLSSLSMQYYNLSHKYFELSKANSLLFEEESKQINELTYLRDTLSANIINRKKIENKIVQSNDMIQKSILKSILDDEALQQEILMIYQKANYGILFTDEKNEMLIANPFFSELWGINWNPHYTSQELHQIIAGTIKEPDPLFLNLFPFTKNQSSMQRHFQLTKHDGKMISGQLSLFKIHNNLRNLWIFKDSTDKHQQDLSISHLAHHDTMTQLPARGMIYAKLNELINEYQNKDLCFAVAFIDINDFKLINDSLGHGIGNEVLKIFAHRLQNNIRDIDFAGRLGGDEFICIFNNLVYKSDVDPLIKKLKMGLEENLVIQDNNLIINSSIGISFYPSDTESIDELIGFADTAMYKAKESNINDYERFIPQYTQQTSELHLLGQDLKTALINNAFYLSFQPIYDSHSIEIAKVEVLLRWHDNVVPSVFIPLAERLGLIHDMGLWVLEETCKARLELAKLTSKPVKFCVNISPRQLHTPQQIHDLLEIVANSACEPSWLEFELTESTLVDLDKAMGFINKVKSMGISVAIDDFGTGFSSLSYLKNLYFDDIKIDKQFLANIFEQPREMRIFQAIIHLSQMLEAKITVEGVENKEQFDFCVKAKCHYIQGYYLAKPMDFITLIEKIV